MNKVVLYNIIGMLIVTCIDEYYRGSSMYLCVLYKNKILDGKKNPFQKKLLRVNIAKCLFFMLFIFISWFFFIMYMYLMHTEAKIFNI